MKKDHVAVKFSIDQLRKDKIRVSTQLNQLRLLLSHSQSSSHFIYLIFPDEQFHYANN